MQFLNAETISFWKTNVVEISIQDPTHCSPSEDLHWFFKS